MDARGLTRALHGNWHGSYGTAKCPAHDDRSPSLSISDGDNGGLLVHCHAGCSQDQVIGALSDRGLWNGHTTERGLKPVAHAKFGKPNEIYVYTEDFEVWRWEAIADRPKVIRPLYRLDGEWQWKQSMPPPRPLYRLASLKADTFRPVLLVEGEKTAETAQLLLSQFTVMTWPGGAKAIKQIDWHPLGHRKVICWPDADDEGKRSMREIAAKLTHLGADVRIVDVPSSLPRKWDLADNIPDGLDIEEMIAAAPQYTAEKATLGSGIAVVRPETLAGEPPERPWLVADWIPLRAVTMLSGDGGLGKSLLDMQLQTCCAEGRAWLGQFAKRCVSVGVYCEDEVDELRRRQMAINKALGIDTPPGMHWVTRVGSDNALVTFDRFTGEMEPTGLFEDLHRLTQDLGARLLILDALHDFYPGNENDRVMARRFINLLTQLACDMDGAIVLNAHPSLSGRASGTGESGSTAWSNAVRSRLYFHRPLVDGLESNDRDARILSNRKANYSASGNTIQCRYRDGMFEPKATTPTSAGAVERIFLDAVERLTKQGVNMSFSSHASNYAVRNIMTAGLNDGATSQDLAKALRNLETRGIIGTEKYGKPSNQHTRLAIVRRDLFNAA